MVRYYKLFDLLNRRKMKKSDLREILSPKTVAKLSKGEYLSGEAIEKICLFLGCQPGDIMEIVETEAIEENSFITTKSFRAEEYGEASFKETYFENIPKGTNIAEADETNETSRQLIDSDEP